MPEYQFIGKPANRVDALEKVLGTAKYIDDYSLPNMLLARTIRSGLPHARIKNIDVSAALKIPGVAAVITSEDFVNHGRFGYPVEDMFMLAYERVRYVGDGIVSIAAESETALQQAMDAVVIELEELAAVFDMTESLEPSAALVGEQPRDAAGYPRGNLLTQYVVRKNDPDAEFSHCVVNLEDDYSTMHQEHAYIETEGALAFPGDDGRLTVYAPCQSPFLNRDNMVKTLGLPEAQIRVIQPVVGGAFGGKDDLMYQISAQVAKLALLTGRPVKMILSREESMIASYKRDAMRMHVHLGADSDGRLRASRIHSVVDSGAYSSITPFTAWRSSIHAMGPYRYDACHVDTDVVYTNNGYSGAFRGFGNAEVCFAIESAMDELALILNLDPIELRLQNCLRPGDTTPHGQKLGEDVALVECLEQVRKLSGWKQKQALYTREASKPIIPGEFRRGMGVAAVFHGVSLGAEGADFAVGTLEINPDYTLTLTSGLTDYGTGSRTAFTLIAAETLGLQPERFIMPRPDTDSSQDSGPTVASRATVLGGNATRVTAESMSEVLDQAAADLFGCEPEAIVRHGELFIGPKEEPASFEEVVDHARKMGLSLTSRGRWSAPDIAWSMEKGQGKPYFAYHYGAQVAEVLVDTGTGKVDVTGFWAVHNTGKVIFPQGAYGQLFGGIVQGLGYALMERVDFDQGFMQATNFDEYLIPTALDVPDIEGAFIEKPFSTGPFGAKNLGETGLVPAAPAIVNAIANATGRRIRNLPANLERVLLGKDLRKEGSSTACKLGLK